MIPTIANIRKAIYCLNKRIDQLEGGNYLDTMVELSNKVSALESLLDDDALNPTTAIDKFNEIVAFLNSIDNTETLLELLRDTILLSYQQNYVTVSTYANLPTTGSADTIYRVSNYNGSTNQIDTTSYSEYVWDNSDYTLLCVKSLMNEVFDISVYHATGGTLATYADLSAALDSNNGGGVPTDYLKGGMSIKFVRNSDNKYVQYRLMSDTFSTTESDWQSMNVDNVPTLNSRNLASSHSVAFLENDIKNDEEYIIATTKCFDYDESVNFLNEDTVEANKCLVYNNGKAVDLDGYYTTDFIPVLGFGGRTVRAQADIDGVRTDLSTMPTYAFARACAYDINMAFIPGSGSNSTHIYVIPENARYIRLTFQETVYSYTNKSVIISEKDTIQPYRAYDGKIIFSKIKDSVLRLESLDCNINLMSNLIPDTLLNRNTGKISELAGYLTSQFIPVTPGQKLLTQLFTGRNIIDVSIIDNNLKFSRVCAYTSNNQDSFISESGLANQSYYIVPNNAKYIRYSITSEFYASPNLMVYLTTSPYLLNYIRPNSTLFDTLLDGGSRKAINIPSGVSYNIGNLNSGQTFRETEYTMRDTCAYTLNFFGKLETLQGDLILGFGQQGQSFYDLSGRIKITSTSIYSYKNGDTLSSQTEHGLTISDYIAVTLHADYKGSTFVEIKTNGGSYKWEDAAFFSYNGTLYVTVGDTMKDCHLSYQCDAIEKSTWIYGDSYLSLTNERRWPYYLVQQGYNNFMFSSTPGGSSAMCLESLKRHISWGGIPKRIIWAPGMNDKDTTDAPNTSWLDTLKEVEVICKFYNIELILTTVPNVPSALTRNTNKNAYVISSGYKYIDFAQAISENGDSVWYQNMLASDNVHPNTEGAKALYSMAIATVPELLLQ